MDNRPVREALPTSPPPRQLWVSAGVLLLTATVALILYLTLQQHISDWPSTETAQLETAIAATQPITPLQTTLQPASVLVIVVGDLRSSTPLTSLRALDSARWQIGDAVQPPESAFATLLRGENSGAMRYVYGHPYTDVNSAAPLSGTLATLVPSRTLILNPAAPAYLQPSAAAIVTEVVQATDSDTYDLLIASLPGLLPCHLRDFDCARVTADLDAALGRIISIARDNDATLIIVGDYGEAGTASLDAPADGTPPLLLLSGSRIRPGIYSDTAYLRDVAPTVAALIGISPPAASDGQVLWPALQLAPSDAADAEYALAAQRIRRAEAQAALSGQSLPLAQPLREDLRLAYEASLIPDYQSQRALSSRAFATAVQQLADLRRAASNAATWSRLPLLLLALAAAIVALLIWRRRIGYWRPVGFYLVIATLILFLQSLTLALLPPTSNMTFADLPSDWLYPTTFVFIILLVAFVGQLILGFAVGWLYRRTYQRTPPSRQHAEELQIQIWQLRTVQPLTRTMLWQAAYTVAFTLLAIDALIALIVWWQFGVPNTPAIALFLLDTFVLTAANALFASFVAPLAAVAAHRLHEPRKPHPLLVRK